jgi:hypothetical protein
MTHQAPEKADASSPSAAVGRVETNLTRRKLISRSVALASAAAVPTIAPALATPAGGSGLAELIEAHRAAWARIDQASERWDKSDHAFHADCKKNPILVPAAVMANGKGWGEFLEFPTLRRDEVEKRIERFHDNLRRAHCSKWSRSTFPDFAAAAEREVEESQARALQALADAEAAIEAREQSFGLIDADKAFDAANEDEFAARLALVLFAPRDEREAAIKRRYFDESPPFSDGFWDTEKFAEALMDHLCLAPASAGKVFHS